MYNKHADAQKTVTLSFREKEKGANLIRFAPFMRRDRVMNLLPNILEIQFLINMSKP